MLHLFSNSESPKKVLFTLLVLLLAAAPLLSLPTLADGDSGVLASTDEPGDDPDDDDADDDGKGNGQDKEEKSKKDKAEKVADDSGAPVCKRRAQKLFNACKRQADADRWMTNADCMLIADDGERRDCAIVAQMQFGVDKNLCLDSRQDRKAACAGLGQEAYTGWEAIDFVAAEAIDGNDFFPLLAGISQYVSAGTTIDREVTTTTREIDGRSCLLVVELESDSDSGLLLERREYLYAEDIENNIWQCGVLRQQFSVLDEAADPVVTGVQGSWQAGMEGALPGLAMPAQPLPGSVFRRSLVAGVSEDIAEVIDPAAITPSLECVSGCLILRVTSPLHPGAYRDEYYLDGQGLVRSEDHPGGDIWELVP